MKDPRKVFNAFKQQCSGKLKKVEVFVASHMSTSLTSDNLDRLRDLNTALKEQWSRMEVAWDNTMVSCIEDESDPDEELAQLVSDTGKAFDETLVKSWTFIRAKLSATAASPAPQTPSTGHARLEMAHCPKNALSHDMTLEESNLWFPKFEAFFGWNKKALEEHSK
jgi:hypothetical protein